MWESLGSTVISTLGSLMGGKQQQQASQDMAREQMAFQERMSNSAYQRSMEDMRLAGLNPILAYQKGGATTPSGAQGQAVDIIGNAARTGVSTAMQSRRLEAELKNMEETNNNLSADTNKKVADTQLSHAARDNTEEDTNVKRQSERTLASQQALNQQQQAESFQRTLNAEGQNEGIAISNRILEQDLHSAKAAAAAAKSSEELFNSDTGKTIRKVGNVLRELNPLGGLANSARNVLRR